MRVNVYAAILVMGLVTYLIRALPLTIIRRKIKSPFLRSFLFYVPYVSLSAMTIPAIFLSTGSVISAAVGLIVAVILCFRNKNLIIVSLGACAAVFITEFFIPGL